MEKNYGGKIMFAFDKYEELIKVIGKRIKDGDDTAQQEMDMVSTAVAACLEYVNNVDNGENAIRCSYARLEGEDLRRAIMGIDRSRRYAHEAAISHVNILNRIATMFNHVGEIFVGDIEDRLQVADFCLEVTNKLFTERKK